MPPAGVCDDGLFSTLLVAYCALVANGQNLSQAEFVTAIQSQIGFDEATLNGLYEMLIDMPYYYLPYAYGYAKLRYLERTAEEKQGAAFDQKAFFTEYLNCGPSYFNLIEARLSGK